MYVYSSLNLKARVDYVMRIMKYYDLKYLLLIVYYKQLTWEYAKL